MKRPVRSSLMAWTALVCALVFVPALFADSQARIVRLSYTDGKVQIDRNTGDFEKAILNMPIIPGTRLVTQAGARAEVEFEDGSNIRLGPAAEVDFTDLALRDDGGKVSAVTVAQGMVYFDIEHHKNDDFRVAFGTEQVTLDRSVRFRIDVAEDRIQVAVYKGQLEVQGAEDIAVKKNHTLSIDPVNGTSEIAKGIAEDSLDDWVQSREDYVARYASNQSYGAPYSGYYGLGDLNYYGNYFYQPGWGWMWRPYSVGLGWDPFFDGAWCWYPGFGYTWVSSYPWGWIPYRYGRWAYVPGWGWGWMAGGWNGWQTVPVIVNPPTNFRGLQPPAQPPNIPTSPRPVARPNPHPTIIVEGRQPRVAGRDDTPLPPRPVRGARPDMPTAGDSSTATRTPAMGRQPSDGQPSRRVGTDGDSARPSRRSDHSGDASPRADRPSTPAPSPRVDRPSSPPPSAPRVDRPSSPPMSPAPSMPRGGEGPSRPSGSGRPPH